MLNIARRTSYWFALCCLAAVVAASPAHAQPSADLPPLQLVASFYGAMPTGVTVSIDGRIFVCFPRWTDKGEFTVGRVVDGSTQEAYPNAEINRFDPKNPSGTLVSVQSVVVDPHNRLWLLDTGSINFAPVIPGGAKLIGVDLNTNTVFKTIVFPSDVALPTSYLNDIRFDLRRGSDGVAYITDSSGTGPNGIVVVDLATGKSYRRLNDHPSTKAVPNFLPTVEGQPLLQDEPGKPPQYITLGSDGIAISADGMRLFYTPLASRRLYSVSTNALLDRAMSDEQVAATVADLGEKSGGSDGLESDGQGRVYLTEYEHNVILRRNVDGGYDTIAHFKPYEWPDTMSISEEGYLYVMTNQLQRQPNYHDGQELRQRPYNLYRLPITSSPIRLRP